MAEVATPAQAATPPAQAAPPAATPPAEAKPLTQRERMAKAIERMSGAKTAPEPKPAEAAPAATPEKPAAEPTKDEKASARFAELARREARIVERSRAERARIESERKALEKDKAEISDARKTLEAAKRSPLAWLKAAGLSYEDASREYLAGGAPDPVLVAKSTAADLEAFKAEQKRLAQENAQRERQRLVQEQATARSEFFDEVRDTIASKAAEFPLTNTRAGAGLVMAIVEESWKLAKGDWKKTKTVDEAAAIAEAHYRKQREKEDEVLGKSKPAEKPAPAAAAEPPKPAAPTTTPTSLTQDLAARTPESFAKSPRSASDYRARAMALLDRRALERAG